MIFKLSALFMALTMAVSLMVTPAAASDGVSGAVQDFFEWSVNAQRETGDAFWRAIYGDSWNPDGGFSDGVGADRTELTEKYSVYTDTMQTELGSTEIVGGAVRYYFDWWLDYVGVNYGKSIERTEVGPVVYVRAQYTNDDPTEYPMAFVFKGYRASSGLGNTSMSAPLSGYADFGYHCTVDSGATYDFSYDGNPVSVAKGSALYARDFTATLGSIVQNGWYSCEFCEWVDITPLDPLSDILSVDVAEPSRAGSIAGDVYVVNENGEETVYNDYSVVNETTNIYNDPISGTERPVKDWAYDYIERQYNITLEDGANVTIKYGDENIEIVEGDSIETLNYGSGSSVEGGGDDEGGGSGIGDAIANLFTVLGEIILGLITALINLATKALDALKGLFDLFWQLVETITGFFGGFTDFLAGVFPFLPEETFTIFNFGLILLVAATVFRKFLK